MRDFRLRFPKTYDIQPYAWTFLTYLIFQLLEGE